MRLGSSPSALVAIFLAALPALAQITVSQQLAESALADADFQKQFPSEKQGLTAALRPNAADAGVYFVYAKNPAKNVDDLATLVVELRGAKDEFIAEGRAEKVPGGSWKVVRFAKPAVAPAPVPAPAPGAAPVEPALPGTPVARGGKGFEFILKQFVIDAKGVKAEALDADKKPIKETLKVSFMAPADYGVTVGDLKSGDNKTAGVVISPPKAGGKSTAKITFPGQKDGQPPAGVVGLFAVTLDPNTAATDAKVTLGGRFPNGLVPLHLAIDGVERVAVYDPATISDKGEVKATSARKVRVVPVGGAVAVKPSAAYAVRVETDNAGPNDTLELRVRRTGDSGASDEVIPLGGPRDERLWVDAAEPTKQGLGFATKTSDWVKMIDLSAARGEMDIEAVLKPQGGTKIESALKVIVDAEAPAVTGVIDVGDPAKPKEKLLKGATLPVRATVKDEGGAGVQKVSFLLFTKLQPDGTLPPDAVAADGVRVPKIDAKTKKLSTTEFTDEWVAELTPPDKKGKYLIAAVATDRAGNEGKVTRQDPAVKVIELVDPTAGAAGPRGSIAGIVIFGGLPQPGLKVAVGGADGKAKAVATTDDKGRFCIPDVLPGAYTVVTLKTNSALGFTSQADVTVEPEKTAKVTLELVRNK